MTVNPKAALLAPVVVLLAACGPTAKAIDPPQPGQPPYALLAGAEDFYVNPDNPAAKWVRTAPPGPRTDAIRTRIATRPAATLIAEPAATAPERVRAVVTAAAAVRKLPILLLDADRAGACADGGARWFGEVARGLRDDRALVVVRGRHCEAGDAAHALAAAAHATVLLDVSDAASPEIAAQRVAASGPDVDGFATDVGGYTPERAALATSRAISRALAASTGKRDYTAVIDSSRNAEPVSGACNPAGARIGSYESLSDDGAPQQLWLTVPGISDGPCGSASSSRAGDFVPDLAAALAQR
ncbi:glycoside hydrolase family 6 protein [Amycolatopsis sp. NPDC023774]|uniref:glycoside hydrolase family 6 protein n=1 Tax=Amycolatopsis sp. NPDC023774 TaxID=3155015 RepID=UPI0033EECBEC